MEQQFATHNDLPNYTYLLAHKVSAREDSPPSHSQFCALCFGVCESQFIKTFVFVTVTNSKISKLGCKRHSIE